METNKTGKEEFNERMKEVYKIAIEQKDIITAIELARYIATSGDDNFTPSI